MRFALLSLFLTSAAVPAVAAQSFDGAWTLNVTTRNGSCDSYAWEVAISQGRIQTPPNLPVSGSGRVTPAGVVSVQFTRGSDVMTASGSASGRQASGNWKAPSLSCSGSWRAVRH